MVQEGCQVIESSSVPRQQHLLLLCSLQASDTSVMEPLNSIVLVTWSRSRRWWPSTAHRNQLQQSPLCVHRLVVYPNISVVVMRVDIAGHSRKYDEAKQPKTRSGRRRQTSPPVPPLGEVDKTRVAFILACSLH